MPPFVEPSATSRLGSEHIGTIAWRGIGMELGGRSLITGVDLELAPGDKVALVGPSGAGKTTLLRIGARLLNPTAGQFCLEGRPLFRLNGQERRRFRSSLMYLPQLSPLIPHLPVVHNVLWGSVASWTRWQALRSLIWPRQTEQVRAALDRVGLADRMWDLPESLSGGEKQRVAVARLIVACPSLLFADEPAASLDISRSCDAVGMMLEASQACGTTVLLSLHDLALLKCGFDRIVAMRDGAIVWQGTPETWTPQVQAQVFEQPGRGPA